MRVSYPARRKAIAWQRAIAVTLIVLMIGPCSPAFAEELGEHVRGAVDDSVAVLFAKGLFTTTTPQTQVTPQQRAAQVTSIQLCPRQLSLYVEETFAFVPVGVDNTQKIVHGVSLSWQSSAPATVSVQSTGEVTAVSPGTATVTVTIGTSLATATVRVLAGMRPKQTDAVWDEVHKDDCSNPIGAKPPTSERANQIADKETHKKDNAGSEIGRSNEGTSTRISEQITTTADGKNRTLENVIRSAAFGLGNSGRKEREAKSPEARPAAAFTTTQKRGDRSPVHVLNLPEPIDGDSGDSFSPSATAWYNVVGNPRYMPQEELGNGGIRTRRKLGSYDYSFSAPVLSLGGRGVGVNLELIYNSRLWNKETDAIQFNYNKGWPAAGWTFGYGRIIENYDNTATGDQSGFGFANSPGNYLLIQPDGTRIHMERLYDSTIQRWYHISKDGSYLELSPQKNLRYPDGAKVSYVYINNRLLPNFIQTRNGDQITVTYRPRTEAFKFRWAIDQIQDTLGRLITFRYYGDSGYDAGPGKPAAALAALTAPDQIDGKERVLVKLEYENVDLHYNFSPAPPENSVPPMLTVVRKIYYPATGEGYLFEEFSSYGMARKISLRKDMNNPSYPGGTDGTPSAYTFYDYPLNEVESGQLQDAPKYTHRHEWWVGKTDAQGNAVSTPTIYTYQRDPGAFADTVYIPDSTNTGYILKMITAGTSAGFASSVETRNNQDQLLQRTETLYSTFGDSVPLPRQILVTNEASETAKTIFDYYTNAYGRVRYIDEYGFTASIQRRTEFEYMNDTSFIDHNLLRLVKWQRVYSGSSLTQAVAMTRYFYDEYPMEYYPGQSIPATHNSSFDQFYSPRGNLTTARRYSSINPDVYHDQHMNYDIFGNMIEEDVNCCHIKKAGFSYNTTWFSQPDWTRDGDEQAPPYLDTGYQYDFYTGLVKQVTVPNGQSVSYGYDSAWRLDTATNNGTGAQTITRFDKDSYQNDQLSYFERALNDENGMKTITSRSWFDGAGHSIRVGTGAGASPSTYDMAAATYDYLGRSTRQSNPYTGDSSGNGTPQYFTVSLYDVQSRVFEVDLPDDNPQGQRSRVQTAYNGSTVTVTDQVGRQRRSQVDGLGRLITVTEQDPASGALTLTTSYSYNVLDKLTQVSQGGQTRAYKYDTLGRLLFEKTPEQTATIPEGALQNQWTAAYTYTDFDAVLTRQDARGVVTTYGYGALNRLETITYNVSGAQNVEATNAVTLTYHSSGGGKGQVETINNGMVLETFGYDAIGRLGSLARTFPGNINPYTTSYEYNAANQPIYITYPSNKRLRINHDARGRMSGLDKMNGSVVETSYLSLMSYNVAGQLTSMTLGSGVVDTFTYDGQRLQLTRQTATKSGSTLMDLNYSYAATAGSSGTGTTAGNSGQLMAITNNPNAQPSTINGQNRNQAFTYDDLGRLLTATGTGSAQGPWQRRFAYDRFGNRTGVWDATSGGSQIQSVSLQESGGVPTNRLTSVTNGGTTVSYTYDDNGNVTSDGVHLYRYDAENRLVKVDAGANGTYSYDTANCRVKKEVDGYTTYCIWQGGLVIAEYSDGPVEGSGGLKYYEADRLSTRLVTSSTGAVQGMQDHQPFGEEAGVAGESEKHRFTNYERDDEIGSDYAVNRQYEPTNGRFMLPDPFKGNAGNPQSFNRYVYTTNDPVNLVDPDGQLMSFPILTGIDWFGILGWAFISGTGSYLTGSGGGFDGGGGSGGGVFISPGGGQGPVIPERLSPCLQRLFQGFYTTPNFTLPLPLDLSSVVLHTGLPAFSKLAVISAGAITLGKDIYFSGPGSFDVATIAHELVHVEQYGQFAAISGALSFSTKEKEEAGERAFAAAYGADYLRALLQGKSGEAAYRDIFLERWARAKTRAVLQKISTEGRDTCGLSLGSEDPD